MVVTRCTGEREGMLTGGNGHMIEWGDVANKSTGWIEFEARRPSSSMDEDDDILRFDSLI